MVTVLSFFLTRTEFFPTLIHIHLALSQLNDAFLKSYDIRNTFGKYIDYQMRK